MNKPKKDTIIIENNIINAILFIYILIETFQQK
jgi:hypothetical protein